VHTTRSDAELARPAASEDASRSFNLQSVGRCVSRGPINTVVGRTFRKAGCSPRVSSVAELSVRPPSSSATAAKLWGAGNFFLPPHGVYYPVSIAMCPRLLVLNHGSRLFSWVGRRGSSQFRAIEAMTPSPLLPLLQGEDESSHQIFTPKSIRKFRVGCCYFYQPSSWMRIDDGFGFGPKSCKIAAKTAQSYIWRAAIDNMRVYNGGWRPSYSRFVFNCLHEINECQDSGRSIRKAASILDALAHTCFVDFLSNPLANM